MKVSHQGPPLHRHLRTYLDEQMLVLLSQALYPSEVLEGMGISSCEDGGMNGDDPFVKRKNLNWNPHLTCSSRRIDEMRGMLWVRRNLVLRLHSGGVANSDTYHLTMLARMFATKGGAMEVGGGNEDDRPDEDWSPGVNLLDYRSLSHPLAPSFAFESRNAWNRNSIWLPVTYWTLH